MKEFQSAEEAIEKLRQSRGHLYTKGHEMMEKKKKKKKKKGLQNGNALAIDENSMKEY